jgi:hypothetical protein
MVKDSDPKPMPVGVVMVAEESLDAIKEFPEPVLVTVERILMLVKEFRSSDHFSPSSEIPDEAPSKVKDQLAQRLGKSYTIGIKMNDGTNLCLSWYEPNDRRMVFFWDIAWPVTIITTD